MKLNQDQKKFLKKLYECNQNGTGYWISPRAICSEIGIESGACERTWHPLLDEQLLRTSQRDHVHISEHGKEYLDHPVFHFFTKSISIKFFWGIIVFAGAVLSFVLSIKELLK